MKFRYTQTRLKIKLSNSLCKKKKKLNSKNREPMSLSRKLLFKFSLVKCKSFYIRNATTVPPDVTRDGTLL